MSLTTEIEKIKRGASLEKRCWFSPNHSFETRPGGRPGLMIGSRVRWVDPGQPKKKRISLNCNLWKQIR
jgi:hypothetical protein